MKVLAKISLVFVVITCLLLTSIVVEAQDTKYVVFMDAGSTGTRVYIYSYLSANNAPVVSAGINAITQTGLNFRVQPGLATLNSNLSAIPGYFTPLINFATTNIPASQQATTPLFLTGTAGFRILDPNLQSSVMNASSAFLQAQPFNFQFARVISGTEEGAFSWISVNFLAGKLGSYPSSTFTSLDLGGASTQIAFVSNDSSIPASDRFLVTYNGVNYPLYSHSYLYYGLDQFRILLLNYTLNVANTTVNPCFFSGYSQIYLGFNITGSSDPATCASYVLALLGLSNYSGSSGASKPANTGINGVYQPAINSNYNGYLAYAFSGFFNQVGPLEGAPTSPAGAQLAPTVGKILQDVYQACTLDWTAAQARFNQGQFNSGYCIGNMYVALLLGQGYGFSSNLTQISFQSVDTPVQPVTLEYTLGATLYYTALNYTNNVCPPVVATPSSTPTSSNTPSTSSTASLSSSSSLTSSILPTNSPYPVCVGSAPQLFNWIQILNLNF